MTKNFIQARIMIHKTLKNLIMIHRILKNLIMFHDTLKNLYQLNAQQLMKKLSSRTHYKSAPLMTNMYSTNTQRRKVITTQAYTSSESKKSSIHSINSTQFHNNWLSQHHHITDKTIKEIDKILDEYEATKTEPNIPRTQAPLHC